jgi:hypothetical protein
VFRDYRVVVGHFKVPSNNGRHPTMGGGKQKDSPKEGVRVIFNVIVLLSTSGQIHAMGEECSALNVQMAKVYHLEEARRQSHSGGRCPSGKISTGDIKTSLAIAQTLPPQTFQFYDKQCLC